MEQVMAMQARLRIIAVLAIILCSSANAEPPLVSKLSWLAGCWASERGEVGSGEQWMAAAGGTVFGVGRTIKGGKTVEHEFLQIREVNDSLTLIAAPSGQAIATFSLLKLTNDEVIFENLQHDFPQRVAYRLASQARLVGRIEGIRNGKLAVIEFPLVRTTCEPVTSAK